MHSPKFSVIIPAYNQAEFLSEAIVSVLNQTCRDFEVIIVNDASPDQTNEIVKRFIDPRITLLVHPENRGASATRNTGIRASSGEYIAFLDADDYFHPNKLQVHMDYIAVNPDVSATYNSHYELNHSQKTIRGLWRPPKNLSMADFVVGFPFAPSDVLIRRDWLDKVGLFDESYRFYGDDLDMNCKLALAGCKFGNVDRALNYRRYHSRRKIMNIAGALETMLHILVQVFSDPRCEPGVRTLSEIAYSNTYRIWGFVALQQEETELGQNYLREAIRLNPDMLDNNARKLIDFLIHNCILDENVDHGALMELVFAQLPQEIGSLSEHYDWAVARGYLIKGLRAIMWNRSEAGDEYFSKAIELGAEIDISYIELLTYQLLNFEYEFGGAATKTILRKLIPYIQQAGNRRSVRQLMAHFNFNQAMTSYYARRYKDVIAYVVHVLRNDPTFITNRGLLAIFFHSIISKRLGAKSK